MKKLLLLFLFCICSLAMPAKPLRLNSHCVFMHYDIDALGHHYEGSSLMCIEWFWRAGVQPVPGQQTNGYLDVKRALGDQLPPGTVCEVSQAQVITITMEGMGDYNFRLPAGSYTVNDAGEMDFKAIVIE